MKNLDKIIKLTLYFLLLWYFISPFIWIGDDTLSSGFKICYAIINYSIIVLLFRVLYFEYKNQSINDYSVSIMMIIWFLYSTYRDYTEQGYYLLLKMFYISIDLLSLVFCIDTFINFILNSKLFILNEYQIKNINNFFKMLLAGSCFYIYFYMFGKIK